MHKQKGFTSVELLVVISIIALLMAILAPSLQQARKQAKAVVCLSNMHQWSLVWSMYAQDHDEHYFGYGSWRPPLRPYYKDLKILLCPMAAARNWDNGGYLGDPFSAWGYAGWYASYGMNGFFQDPMISVIPGSDPKKHWRRAHVKGSTNVPLFLDANWVDGWPEPTDEPPEFNGQFDWGFSNNMRRYCVNRHNSVVNSLFADFSARKIGLKQLWKLKWHRNYDISYPAPVWPDWMKTFKDYD